ncbi:MAG: hypothetical protein XD69_0177 [Clostridia bacterium 62_21]|nr:MAG: hypothetical protein XD69_0177 [Clostridia bacterium 62_21]HAG07667.1 hypothetical protein [Peptococcaceae bacterium]
MREFLACLTGLIGSEDAIIVYTFIPWLPMFCSEVLSHPVIKNLERSPALDSNLSVFPHNLRFIWYFAPKKLLVNMGLFSPYFPKSCLNRGRRPMALAIWFIIQKLLDKGVKNRDAFAPVTNNGGTEVAGM